MSRSVVLLRAVNVGGTALPMAKLREALSRAGSPALATLGASGNAVVDTNAGGEGARLETAIQTALAEVGRVETEVFVRSRAQWDAIVRGNPFSEAATTDPAHLVVTVLKSAPSRSAWSGLERAIVGRERVAAGQRHAYLVYPDGIGRSKLTAAVLERQLGVRSTSRNWNTVLALQSLLDQ